MVNEVSARGRAKPPGSGNDGSSNPFQAKSCVHPAAATSFTDPGKLDGVLPVAQRPVLAVDLLHRSGQGGWGRRGTLAERVARKRHHRASLFVCGNLRLSVRRRAGRRGRRREGRRPGGGAASSALVLLTHALWHDMRGAGVVGGRGPGVVAVLDPGSSGTSTGVGRAGVGRSPRETVAVRAGPCVGIASGPTRTELRPKRSIRDGTRWMEGRVVPLIRAAPTFSPLGEKDPTQASVHARGPGGGT